jgi:hypothetical protein
MFYLFTPKPSVMKPLTLARAFVCLTLFLLSTESFSQVKIGGNPKENPHPSAVLELQGTDKGLLLPRLSQQQMQSIKQPANALVVYNTDAKNVYIYSEDRKEWMPLMQEAQRLGEDSCEWVFDTSTLRIFLARGYPLGDSVYYNTARRKFVFADKVNVEGSNTPADVFYPGKYIFKGNASGVFHDSASLNFPSITLSNFLFAIDNDSFAIANPNLAFYNGMRISTQMLPSATQRASTVRSLLLQVNHTGADSLNAVTAMASNAFVDGQGYTATFNGIQNNLAVSSAATNNIGTITGYRSLLSMAPDAGGRVTGNVFGYVGSISGFRDTLNNSLINGNAYGIFLNNINAAQPKRNYAFYSGKGHNRFGDSTLITDQFFTSPRAVLDVNTTSAMIIPSGNTSQRPATGITAMLRNNTDIGGPEYFDGAAWQPLSTGSSEWVYDAITNKVNLNRGLAQGDSVYYNIGRKKFVFADKTTFGNTITPADVQFPGKYIFKATASKLFHDAASVNFPSLTMSNFLYEIDNDSFALANPGLAAYNAARFSTQVLPTATQTSAIARVLNLQLNHTGADSVTQVTSVVSNSFIDGQGYTGSFTGVQNNMAITDGSTNNIGTVTGYRNTISMTPNAGGRVTGNVFGYLGALSGFTDGTGSTLINGNAYGVFLSNITAAAPRKNFAFYSGRGHNRFGDSTLITDNFAINPRAVFDINSTSAMITPAGTTAQRPATAVTAMLRHNNDNATMEYFDGTNWKTLSSDSAEWKFDAVTSRVNLVRGLPVADTVFYNPVSRKFVFSDRYTNTNSLGNDFPVDAFNGKYTFKSTASQRTDPALQDGAVANIVYEVDNAATGTIYTATSSSAVMNPKAFQKADQLAGFSNTAIHAGNDSVQLVIGIANIARNSGNGRSGSVIGIQNVARIQNGNNNNTGELIGFRNIVGRVGTSAGRITGNVYGWFGSFTGLANNVDGNIYGIFLSNVTGATGSRNFAFYSNRGINRFGDSVVITTGAATVPRAILDVNATSAMIVPTGTTAQRPASAVTGMVRYNTDDGGRLETYNGAAWGGIISGGIGIDPPNIPANGGTTVTFAFNGATVGSVVAISPSSALPNGIIIAWARVSAANTIQVRFENNAAGAVNPPSIGYSVRVIQ